MRCEGCNDYKGCPFHMLGSVAINTCPCADCVVKVMCDTACEKLDKHYQETYNQINKK